MGGPGSRSPAFRPGSGPVARAEGHRIGPACPALARQREGGSITKKFAELLGWTIGVESKVGKGSRFTIRIPVQYSEGIPP